MSAVKQGVVAGSVKPSRRTTNWWIAPVVSVVLIVVAAVVVLGVMNGFLPNNNQPPVPIQTITPTKTTISTATPVITDKPTQTPTLTPEPTLSSTPIPTETPVPTETPTTEVFIFKNGALWKEAFFVHFLDGSESAIVGIPSILVGTELIAPMNAYVNIGAPAGGGYTLVIISKNRDWSTGFALAFAAKSLKLKDSVKDGKVQKGDPFAVVEDNSEFRSPFFSENEKISLTIGPVEEPNEVFFSDPKEYLRALIQSAE